MQPHSQSTDSAVPPAKTIVTAPNNFSHYDGHVHPARPSESNTNLRMTSRSSPETFGYGQLEDRRTCQDQPSINNSSRKSHHYCFNLQSSSKSFKFETDV